MIKDQPTTDHQRTAHVALRQVPLVGHHPSRLQALPQLPSGLYPPAMGSAVLRGAWGCAHLDFLTICIPQPSCLRPFKHVYVELALISSALFLPRLLLSLMNPFFSFLLAKGMERWWFLFGFLFCFVFCFYPKCFPQSFYLFLKFILFPLSFSFFEN